METHFRGKRILVTGAGQGIGRYVALRLANLGGEVFALSRIRTSLDTLVEEDRRIKIICVDLHNWEKTRESVQKILPINLLVNNAGTGYLSRFLDVKPEDFDSTFAVNVKAILNVSQIVIKDMIEKGEKEGVILNLSSQASKVPFENHTVYGCTKAAVDMLTK